jgi:uncharacterized membrane protein YphA (DoxX/SURF4 family)
MKKILNHTVIPWFILISSLVLGVICAFVEDFNFQFLVTLCLILTVAFLYRNNFGKPLVATARTLLGLLFLFSGFVKAVDPLGTQYQMLDYFMAYGTSWANSLALPASIGLITAELIIGIALVLNIRMLITAWLAVLMMAFFTVTTLLDATVFSDQISDCGCFGKAITLTNWQTFYKNIVLNILVVILFFGRYRIRNTFSLKNEAIIIVVCSCLFLGFQFYNLRHLPVIDFLDWKVGVKLNPPKTEPVTFVFEYRNKITQEVQRFEIPERGGDWSMLPTNDPNWLLESRTDIDPNPRNIMIPMYSSQDDDFDVSNFIADFHGYTFIVAIHDLEKTNFRNLNKIFALMDFANQNEKEFMFLFDLSATYESIEKFKQKAGRSDFNIYFSDDKSIKAIVRSNPGLILLHDGTVVKKWAWRDIPSVKRVRKFLTR